MAHQTPFAGYAGLIAAASLAFTPAQAQAAQTAPIGTLGYATSVQSQFSQGTGSPFDLSIYDSAADEAEWRRCGWRGCYRRGWRGRRGVDVGGVLAGVAILGGIAAIANASNNRRRDRDVVVVERERVRDRDYNYRPENANTNRRTNRSTSGGSGIDNAVSQCLNEIEQDVRVDSVDGASRIAQGWIVSGTLFNGSGFTCQIDNNGRISDIDFGGFESSQNGDLNGQGSGLAQAGGQWSDDRYADARSTMGGQSLAQSLAARTQDFGQGTNQAASQAGAQPLVPLTSDNMPAYPGGPVPGETYSE